jgi:hypothetical protein
MGSETHFDKTVTDHMITENYDLYRTDRNSFGSGTIICIKNYLKSRLITNFETHNFETVFCELIFKNTKYLLCCVYITPNPKSSHLLEFESIIIKIENNFPSQKLILSVTRI